MAGGGSTDINVNSLAWETLASSTSCSKVNRGYLQPTRGGDINSHPVMYPLLKHFRWQCKMTSVPCTMCFRSLRPSRWPRSLKFPAPVTSSVLVPLRQAILPRPTIPSRISTRCLFTTPKRDVQYTRFPDQHQRTGRPHDQAARIIVFIAIAGAVYYVAQ